MHLGGGVEIGSGAQTNTRSRRATILVIVAAAAAFGAVVLPALVYRQESYSLWNGRDGGTRWMFLIPVLIMVAASIRSLVSAPTFCSVAVGAGLAVSGPSAMAFATWATIAKQTDDLGMSLGLGGYLALFTVALTLGAAGVHAATSSKAQSLHASNPLPIVIVYVGVGLMCLSMLVGNGSNSVWSDPALLPKLALLVWAVLPTTAVVFTMIRHRAEGMLLSLGLGLGGLGTGYVMVADGVDAPGPLRVSGLFVAGLVCLTSGAIAEQIITGRSSTPLTTPNLIVPPPPHTIDPGWHADPAGRSELRYHDGQQWTSAVATNGEVSNDPLEPVADSAFPSQTPVAASAAPNSGSDEVASIVPNSGLPAPVLEPGATPIGPASVELDEL